MMRRLLVPAALAAALLVPSAAVAGDHDGTVTPTPLPTRVTDEASAETFAQAYVIRNGARIAGVVNQFNGRDDFNGRDNRSRTRTRVTVSDAASACLQHPVIAARFGCIVRFNVAVNEERSYARLARVHSNPRPQPVARVRNIGCLAALRINGGPSVTPSVSVAFADCVQRRSIY
jgi:hypothetical protein